MPPRVRTPVYDTYWSLAHRRQKIFFARLEGEAPPWTDDPILDRFKFCNAYRASDRVSQYLIRDVIYGPAAKGLSAEDHLLRIVLFRLFSKIETWELLEEALGPITAESFDIGALDRRLEELRARGSIYTAAFILCANRAYGHKRKHRNHLALVEEMTRGGRLAKTVATAQTLEDVYDALTDYPLIGQFMAYQLAIDINYSELTDFSEDDFTVPGPGALRGIHKCFEDLGSFSHEEVIMMMVDRQETEFARLGLDFRSLFGRRLHAIDCQNLFCEVDKYSREAFPELKSARSRIKARYTPGAALDTPFYPPKWGLVAHAGPTAAAS